MSRDQQKPTTADVSSIFIAGLFTKYGISPHPMSYLDPPGFRSLPMSYLDPPGLQNPPEDRWCGCAQGVLFCELLGSPEAARARMTQIGSSDFAEALAAGYGTTREFMIGIESGFNGESLDTMTCADFLRGHAIGITTRNLICRDDNL